MKTCPYCGKQVLEKDKFCGWCGRKLPVELTEGEKELVEKIREEARRKESERKEAREKIEERKKVEMIRKRAKEEVGEAEKAKTKREKIIEKLTKIPGEEVKKREEFLKTLGAKMAGKKPEGKPPLPPKIRAEKVVFRPVEAKTPLFEKLFIRALFGFLILSIIAAVLVMGFDIFGWRAKPPIVLPPEAERPQEPEEKPEEIIIPPALLSTETSTVLEIPFLDRLPTAFAEGIKSLNDKTLIRIIIEDLEKREVVSLQDFITTMDVAAPADLYQKLEPNFTLFSYSPQNFHVGFMAAIKEVPRNELVAEIKKTEKKELIAQIKDLSDKELAKLALKELLTSWEPEIKEDFDPFFAYLGAGKVMTVQPFTEMLYLGENFRCTIFYQKNLGIYYGIVKDYFIFTTSEGLMLKLIEYKVELTKTLREGDRGAEVEILQAWLAKDINIYPPGLVTGYFGPLTREAVIRFQQKYSDDILKPYGLVEGTGIVDDATRKKLNEIYRK